MSEYKFHVLSGGYTESHGKDYERQPDGSGAPKVVDPSTVLQENFLRQKTINNAVSHPRESVDADEDYRRWKGVPPCVQDPSDIIRANHLARGGR